MLRCLQLYYTVHYQLNLTHNYLLMHPSNKNKAVTCMVARKSCFYKLVFCELSKYADVYFSSDRVFREGYDDIFDQENIDRVRKLLWPTSVV